MYCAGPGLCPARRRITFVELARFLATLFVTIFLLTACARGKVRLYAVLSFDQFRGEVQPASETFASSRIHPRLQEWRLQVDVQQLASSLAATGAAVTLVFQPADSSQKCS